MNYYNKYIKYKNKYLELKGGSNVTIEFKKKNTTNKVNKTFNANDSLSKIKNSFSIFSNVSIYLPNPDNDTYIIAPDHVTAQNLKDIENACGKPILYN